MSKRGQAMQKNDRRQDRQANSLESFGFDHPSPQPREHYVENLEKRVSELENQIGSTDARNRSKEQLVYRDCAACEHMIQKEMENHPFMRDLKEKFERYHYKLVECRNENLLLKRELAMAKKVLCQELGIDSVDFKDLMSHGTEEGFKGRKEKVLVLQQKNRDLERKLSEMEGKEPRGRPKTTPSEEQVRENISEDRKAYWRMELEKRKGYEIGDKERNELSEENADLRHKLERSRTHNKELMNEIRMLKGEIYALSEKSKDDSLIVQSLQDIENQLKVALEDRSDMRRELVGERFRNKSLQEQICLLTEQLEHFKQKGTDDSILIDGLSEQNQRLQTMLEQEQTISQQMMDRYESDLRKMQANHAINYTTLQKLQVALQDKDALVRKLEEQLEQLENSIREKEAALQAQAEEREDEEKEQAEEEEGAADEDKETAETEELTPEAEKEKMESEMQNMRMEITKFRSLYEAAKDEAEKMAQMITALNRKIDEIHVELVETKQMYIRNELERKELSDKVSRLEKALKGKKKKKAMKPWEKGSKSSVTSVQPRSKIDHLNLKLDIMEEENDFLRSFLSAAIGSKAEDYRLFRNIADNTERRFAADIEAIRTELATHKKEEEIPPEDEDEIANEEE